MLFELGACRVDIVHSEFEHLPRFEVIFDSESFGELGIVRVGDSLATVILHFASLFDALATSSTHFHPFVFRCQFRVQHYHWVTL